MFEDFFDRVGDFLADTVSWDKCDLIIVGEISRQGRVRSSRKAK
jgi:hypothetical protein